MGDRTEQDRTGKENRGEISLAVVDSRINNRGDVGRVARSIKEEKSGEGGGKGGGVDFKRERDREVAIVKRIGPARGSERASERASKQASK